jgi:hypothetical protein
LLIRTKAVGIDSSHLDELFGKYLLKLLRAPGPIQVYPRNVNLSGFFWMKLCADDRVVFGLDA